MLLEGNLIGFILSIESVIIDDRLFVFFNKYVVMYPVVFGKRYKVNFCVTPVGNEEVNFS